jgi:hypothetical protein
MYRIQDINQSSIPDLKKYTEHIIGEYQVRFRTGKSTTDQIFRVKNLLE